PEVLADTLDQVRAAGPARVHRALRVRTDDAYLAAGGLLEVATDPGDRAAGADTRDEMGDPAAGLLPDLRARRLVVGLGVGRVGVLVRLPRSRDLLGQPVGDQVVRARVLRRHVGRADDHLGAVRLEHVALILAHLVG